MTGKKGKINVRGRVRISCRRRSLGRGGGGKKERSREKSHCKEKGLENVGGGLSSEREIRNLIFVSLMGGRELGGGKENMRDQKEIKQKEAQDEGSFASGGGRRKAEEGLTLGGKTGLHGDKGFYLSDLRGFISRRVGGE